MYLKWASLLAQLVKNLPALQETWVQSLGWEDPLTGMLDTKTDNTNTVETLFIMKEVNT